MSNYKDLNYQLGFFVGEFIVDNYLPTLSIDMIKTRNVIQCTIAEADEYHRLHDLWSEEYQINPNAPKDNWENYLAYGMELTIKYLPHNLVCYVSDVSPTDIALFKEGICDSLWNCDCCSYHLAPETIDIKNDKYSTKITFKLQTEW